MWEVIVRYSLLLHNYNLGAKDFSEKLSELKKTTCDITRKDY
jgi:hypothetical protein